MQTNLKEEVLKVKFAAKKLNVMTHPVRVKIIELLLENQKLNVTQIYEKLGLIQAETSLHLGLLKDYGILNKVREGKMSIYSVNTDGLQYILKIANDLQKKK
ncbi:MAG: metalloregulator ArsR/SmtB family transcription factor [Bacteroidota bacterium]